jgi:hypothetical protein
MASWLCGLSLPLREKFPTSWWRLGDPLLTEAAIDAVKQWKYDPYRLKGKPIEVETIIYVNFDP